MKPYESPLNANPMFGPLPFELQENLRSLNPWWSGHLAESALGYFLASIPNLDVAHFPLRGAEPEIDFVITKAHAAYPSKSNTANALTTMKTPEGFVPFWRRRYTMRRLAFWSRLKTV